MIRCDETYRSKPFTLKTPVAIRLFKLYDVISVFAENCEKKGFERGQNLLLSLNEGSLSMDDFARRIKQK